MPYTDYPTWNSTGTPDVSLFDEQLRKALMMMEPDMFVSYELDLRGKQFEPVSLDAELRAAVGDAAYRGLSTYGYHKPVTVFVAAEPTDELAALIEEVGAKHLSEPEVTEDQPVKTRRKRG